MEMQIRLKIAPTCTGQAASVPPSRLRVFQIWICNTGASTCIPSRYTFQLSFTLSNAALPRPKVSGSRREERTNGLETASKGRRADRQQDGSHTQSTSATTALPTGQSQEVKPKPKRNRNKNKATLDAALPTEDSTAVPQSSVHDDTNSAVAQWLQCVPATKPDAPFANFKDRPPFTLSSSPKPADAVTESDKPVNFSSKVTVDTTPVHDNPSATPRTEHEKALSVTPKMATPQSHVEKWQSITQTPEHLHESFEELRIEDYKHHRGSPHPNEPVKTSGSAQPLKAFSLPTTSSQLSTKPALEHLDTARLGSNIYLHPPKSSVPKPDEPTAAYLPDSGIKRRYHEAPVFGGSVLTIFVGPEPDPKAFWLHETLVRRASGYIDKTCDQNWGEDSEKFIELPDHHPEHFELFFLFLYARNIFSTHDTDLSDGTMDLEWPRLVKACSLGRFLQAHDFQDAVMDAILQKVDKSGTSLPPSLHRLVYENTEKDVILRRLFVDIAAWRWNTDLVKAQKEDQAWQNSDQRSDFFVDLAVALNDTKKTGQSGKPPFEAGNCAYHEHRSMGKKVPCYKNKFRS